jgi:CubicO group peptidase (beta-lactamase class C family)
MSVKKTARQSVLFSLLIVLAFTTAPAQQHKGRLATAASPAHRGLARSSPEKQGVSSTELLALIDALDKEIDQMHSIMLVRHGRVIAEGWWNPYDSQTPHVLYSLSKSFTSTAVGLAIAEGKLSLDDQVLKFFPDEVPTEPSNNLKAMRVRDLLRMNTGHQTEPALRDPSTTTPPATWVRKFLAHPVPFKPGSHFLYNSPATYMASAIVQKVTGQTVLEYLRPRILDPLGFKDPQWITSPEGISAGAYGFFARTEEIATFGQLYLQKGMWKGRQLIPSSWVEQATALQTSNGSSPASDWDQGYGYQFWRARHQAYRGDGAFGQYCIVIPEADAVVAITSGVRSMQAVMDIVWNKFLPAMRNRTLPEDAASHLKLEARLRGLQVRIPTGEATTTLAATVSGRWYEFAENDRGVKAAAFEFKSGSPVLVVRTETGESRIPVGTGSWMKSRGAFANGIERFLSVPTPPLLAASGGWTAPDTFTVKIVARETPFYSVLNLRFEGDQLSIDSDHHVAFGATKMTRLVGRAVSRTSTR